MEPPPSAGAAGAQRGRAGAGTIQALEAGTGGAWDLEETGKRRGTGEPRGSKHRASRRSPTSCQRRTERRAGRSGKAHAAESRHDRTRVRVRGSATCAAGFLGLRTDDTGPLGIVVPRSLSPRQRSPFCALIRSGEEAEENDGRCCGS